MWWSEKFFSRVVLSEKRLIFSKIHVYTEIDHVISFIYAEHCIRKKSFLSGVSIVGKKIEKIEKMKNVGVE